MKFRQFLSFFRQKSVILLSILLILTIFIYFLSKNRQKPVIPELLEVPRQGIADSSYPDCSEGFSWRYMWNPPKPMDWVDCVENIPMLAWGPSTTEAQVIDRLNTINSQSQRTEYVLVLNEPDSADQADISPEDAAVWYHDVIIIPVRNLSPNLSIIVGGVSYEECGREWLRRFKAEYRRLYGEEVPRGGWHLHAYSDFTAKYPECPDDGYRAQIFVDSRVRTPIGLYGHFEENMKESLKMITNWQIGREEVDEVWFTEIGCLNAGGHQETHRACQNPGFMDQYMALVLNYLNGPEGRQISRYAWYSNFGTIWWTQTYLCKDECDTLDPVWNTWGQTYIHYPVKMTTGLRSNFSLLPLVFR